MGARKIADIINKELEENNVRDTKGNILSFEKKGGRQIFEDCPRKTKKSQVSFLFE